MDGDDREVFKDSGGKEWVDDGRDSLPFEVRTVLTYK